MKVGSLVVCIDDTNWRPGVLIRMGKVPVKNGIYRIRRIIPNLMERNEPYGVCLEEIYGNWSIWITYDGRPVYEEYHFKMERFAEVSYPEITEEIEEKEIENVYC